LPLLPGKVERREFEYIRHGTLSFMINFDVVTGEVICPSMGPTDFDMTLAAPLTFAAICLRAFRGDVHLRGRSQRVRYYAIARRTSP
jgi:hypothetical protein